MGFVIAVNLAPTAVIEREPAGIENLRQAAVIYMYWWKHTIGYRLLTSPEGANRVTMAA